MSERSGYHINELEMKIGSFVSNVLMCCLCLLITLWRNSSWIKSREPAGDTSPSFEEAKLLIEDTLRRRVSRVLMSEEKRVRRFEQTLGSCGRF